MPQITIWLPEKERELWRKAKGDRSWREIAEYGLFGDHKPNDVVSYDEMIAYVEKRLSELNLKS